MRYDFIVFFKKDYVIKNEVKQLLMQYEEQKRILKSELYAEVVIVAQEVDYNPCVMYAELVRRLHNRRQLAQGSNSRYWTIKSDDLEGMIKKFLRDYVEIVVSRLTKIDNYVFNGQNFWVRITLNTNNKEEMIHLSEAMADEKFLFSSINDDDMTFSVKFDA